MGERRARRDNAFASDVPCSIAVCSGPQVAARGAIARRAGRFRSVASGERAMPAVGGAHWPSGLKSHRRNGQLAAR